jgi:hypothetical protein
LALAPGIDVEELYAAAGYLTPGALPELRLERIACIIDS